ncbi:hypothetical protein OIDMADRAFT_23134 [Oidiodendron maius Zn]|uniref:Uncharacterized protein n=1 Tax=Oidiodendron maius (strain Zn) TaxID=913774 RepID=A0A0C3HJB8_OIDMZ|nr:hypothetical protein OIDMADRAFT_23134 [Oidiodendron maius Zn]
MLYCCINGVYIDTNDKDKVIKYNDDSDASNSPDYNDNIDYDKDNKEDRGDDAVANDDRSDRNTDESADHNSGYNSNKADTPITEGGNNCCTIEADWLGKPRQQDCNATDIDEFRELIRKYKVLCYEDICLWVVRNPRRGERDVLAIEVHLHHYKEMDNKPKPITFLFQENILPILCPISYILTYAIRDNAILVNGYTSAKPFFMINLQGIASNAIHDQVIQHDPFIGVFNGAYINGNVRFNVQDAFLKSDISDDRLTWAFTYMSIWCNPGAPEAVPIELMDKLLAIQPGIVELDRQFRESCI